MTHFFSPCFRLARAAFRFCCLFVYLFAISPAPAADPPAVETLLRGVQIDARDVGIRANDLNFMVGARPRSQLVQLLMTEPLRADGLTRVLAKQLAESAAGNPMLTLSNMSRWNAGLLARDLLGDPTQKQQEAAKKPGALKEALAKCGGAKADDAKLNALPASVQQAAALLLMVELDGVEWVKRSRQAAPAAFWPRLEKKLREPLKTGKEEEKEEAEKKDPDWELEYKNAVEAFDTHKLMVAAQDVLTAAQSALKMLREDKTLADAKFDFQIKTEQGWVVLADSRDNRHVYDGPIFLILDLGGNDTYANAGANAGRQHMVSVALDLAGNDVYKAELNQFGSFGAGTLGVGILWDDGGDDKYEADRRSQGAGAFGIGVLLDAGGTDYYKSIDESQASATAGYGLLIDRAGNDVYESYRSSQAFAGPNAAAALIDLNGNDKYIANDTDIRYPAPQSAEHNVSLSQGAATGWRADYTDGLSINGGVAVLLDAAGDDSYVCGIFGQGTGYWLGAGLLIDLAGDDSYLGQWYVQGASAHYAAGLLIDRAGKDRYIAKMNMSQGAGHDVGIGVLIDDAGDDVYEGSSLGLGASNAAGVGVFLDKAGNDKYWTPNASCLGWVNPNDGYRGLFRSYGLFFDLGGNDQYAGPGGKGSGRAEPGNGKTWPTPPDANALMSYMFGYGFDVKD